MSLGRQLRHGLRALIRPQQADRDLRDEVEDYIDHAVREHMTRGMGQDEARRTTILELGNATAVREQIRTSRWEHAIDTTWRDVRHAVRTLRRHGGFAVVMLLTLALGIGANTAIFSVAESVLLKPLPYPRDDQLMQLWSIGGKASLRPPGRAPLSYQQVTNVSGLHRDLTGVAAFTESRFNLSSSAGPREVQAAIVSPSTFGLLAVRPEAGRDFEPADLHQPVVILSHALWIQMFNGDSAAIGRVVTLDGKGYTIVGVMPSTVAFPDDGTQLWMPLGQAFVAQPDLETDPDIQAFSTIARVRDGVPIRRLTADLATLARRQPPSPGLAPPGFAVMRLRDEAAGDARTPLLVMLAVVGFVLIIACTNAANLLLARSTARQREFAVRRALGAGRGRLIRQLLTESILLALGGGVVGIAFAEVGVSAILRAWPNALPRTHQIGVDGMTLAYALAVSLAVGTVFGLAPAWRSGATDVDTPLREGSITATTGPARQRLQRGLVGAEVALAMIVLTGAGLLVRSFVRLRAVDPGYDVHGVLAGRIRLSPERYGDDAQKIAFYERSVDALRREPGVTHASVSLTLPMSGEVDGFRWGISGPDDYVDIDQNLVAPDFFATMRIPVVAGRTFTDADRDNTERVAVVNGALARRLWPHENPIGRTMDLRDGPTLIVGEIGNIHYSALTDPVKAEIYLPFAQGQSEFARDPDMSAWLVARTDRDPLHLVPAMRRAVTSVDPEEPVAAFATLTGLVAVSTAARSFNTTLVSIFALLAFGLALVGIYGVTAYTVQQRTREIGVRMALGAARGEVIALVLRETGAMTAVGTGVGLVGAFALTRLLATLLYGVSVTDPVTFIAAPIVLVAAALVAALLPALRAARIDPVQALRA